MDSFAGCLEIFETESLSDVSEVRQKYMILAKKYHPDLNPTSEDAHFKMSQVNLAYDFLLTWFKNEDRDKINIVDYEETVQVPKEEEFHIYFMYFRKFFIRLTKVNKVRFSFNEALGLNDDLLLPLLKITGKIKNELFSPLKKRNRFLLNYVVELERYLLLPIYLDKVSSPMDFANEKKAFSLYQEIRYMTDRMNELIFIDSKTHRFNKFNKIKINNYLNEINELQKELLSSFASSRWASYSNQISEYNLLIYLNISFIESNLNYYYDHLNESVTEFKEIDFKRYKGHQS